MILTTFDGDTAVALLRTGHLSVGEERVWATQDLPIPMHARKLFLLGVRWQLAQRGFVKMSVDDDYQKLIIDNQIILEVTVVEKKNTSVGRWGTVE